MIINMACFLRNLGSAKDILLVKFRMGDYNVATKTKGVFTC